MKQAQKRNKKTYKEKYLVGFKCKLDSETSSE